jgi:hypothetical protein
MWEDVCAAARPVPDVKAHNVDKIEQGVFRPVVITSAVSPPEPELAELGRESPTITPSGYLI